MVRRVVFFASLGAGAELAEGFEFTNTVSNLDLDELAWQYGVSFAESYGVYEPSEDDPEDVGEGLHGYTWDDVEGYWEEYNPEKHDGLITYGNEKPRWNKQ